MRVHEVIVASATTRAFGTAAYDSIGWHSSRLACAHVIHTSRATGEFVTAEREWMDVLQNVPVWDAPQASVLVIAPHPDDETLGGGGLIAAMSERGFDISVAAVTDGEHAYPGDTPQQSRELRRLRIDEQTRALERLGVSPEKIVRFGLPDSAVENHFDALVDRLLPLASADTHLIAPWRDDFHPDHRACGLAAERVAVRTGARLTSYFFWTWHHGSPAEVGALTLRRFPLTPALQRAKREALACHHSQLYRESGDPILPEHLLEPARRCFETFLVAE